MIATVITTAFEGIWVPYFVNKMNRKEYRDINAMAIKYIELMLVAMMGVILIGPEIIKILATKSYWKGIGNNNNSSYCNFKSFNIYVYIICKCRTLL